MTQRNQILGAAVGVAGLGLVIAIAYQISFKSVIGQFHDADWRYVPAILLFGFATTVGRVMRYCLFFPFRSHLRLLYAVFAYMRGVMYILPFRLGEPVSLYILKRWGLVPSVSAAAPAWALFRIGDGVAMVILLLPALAFMLPNKVQAIAWASGLAILTCAGVLLLGSVWPRLIERLSRYLASYEGCMAAVFGELRKGLATIRSRSRIAWAGGLSLLIAALNVLVCVWALWCLSLPVSLPTGTAIAVIAQAMSTLPFRPPLGIGLQESVWTGMLVLAGLNSEQAFAGALSVRVAQIAIIAVESILATAIILPSTRIVLESDSRSQLPPLTK